MCIIVIIFNNEGELAAMACCIIYDQCVIIPNAFPVTLAARLADMRDYPGTAAGPLYL